MARQRKWYENWIGRELIDNGRKCKLVDIFYFTDDEGNNAETGYAVVYEDKGYESIICYQEMKRIADQNR